MTGKICIDQQQSKLCLEDFPYLYLTKQSIFNENVSGVIGLARPRPFHLMPIQTYDPERMIIPALESKVSTLLDNLILEPSFTLSFDKHVEKHAEKQEEEKDDTNEEESEGNADAKKDDSAICVLVPDECETQGPKEPEIQTIEKKEIRPTQVIKLHQDFFWSV